MLLVWDTVTLITVSAYLLGENSRQSCVLLRAASLTRLLSLQQQFAARAHDTAHHHKWLNPCTSSLRSIHFENCPAVLACGTLAVWSTNHSLSNQPAVADAECGMITLAAINRRGLQPFSILKTSSSIKALSHATAHDEQHGSRRFGNRLLLVLLELSVLFRMWFWLAW